MSHYAKVNDKDIVTNVIVADQEFIDSYVDTQPGRFVQTSYNTFGGVHYDTSVTPPVPSADQSKALRKNFAGKGFKYDKQRDAFIPPKPFPSYVLNEETCLWDAPVAMPTDAPSDKIYMWDEPTVSWVLHSKTDFAI
jgi:hypothetical protein